MPSQPCEQRGDLNRERHQECAEHDRHQDCVHHRDALRGGTFAGAMPARAGGVVSGGGFSVKMMTVARIDLEALNGKACLVRGAKRAAEIVAPKESLGAGPTFRGNHKCLHTRRPGATLSFIVSIRLGLRGAGENGPAQIDLSFREAFVKNRQKQTAIGVRSSPGKKLPGRRMPASEKGTRGSSAAFALTVSAHPAGIRAILLIGTASAHL